MSSESTYRLTATRLGIMGDTWEDKVAVLIVPGGIRIPRGVSYGVQGASNSSDRGAWMKAATWVRSWEIRIAPES